MPLNAKLQKTLEEAKKAKLDSPGNGTPPSSSGPNRIIRVTSMPAVYKGFKQRVENTDSKRNHHESRYQDGDLYGIDTETITKNRGMWDPSLDPADNRESNKPIYNNDQPCMMWFTGTETTMKISNLCLTTIHKTENGLPCYGDTKIALPVGVRPGCDYLGACWIHLKDNLHEWFSADIHPDGFPFGDRIGWGLPCKPREKYFDYHDNDGSIRRDERLAYIRLGPGADSQIVILGGSKFKVTDITQDMYRNFHHHFIDITDRDVKQLRPVLEEPVEVGRRPKVEPELGPPSIRPAGARSVWEPCIQELKHMISKPLPKSALQVAEIKELLDTIPTRGYTHEVPSFEYLSHAMLAGNMYAAAFRNCVAAEGSSADFKENTIKRLDKVMDVMAGLEKDDDADSTALIHTIGEELNSIRNTAAEAAEIDRRYYNEIVRTMRNIPPAGAILGALPETIVPDMHRSLVDFAAKAVRQVDYNTFNQKLTDAKRKDWKTPVLVDEDEPEVIQPAFTLRGAPTKNDKPSHGNIFKLLSEPRKINVATPDIKMKHEPSPTSLALKRKAEKMKSPSDGLDRQSSRFENGGGTIVWKFTDPGSNLRVPHTRQCCILLGIARSNSWKEMAERCEKEINSKQLFDDEAAKRYGKMLPQ